MTGDGTAWMLIADDDTDFSGDFLNNIYDASRKGQCAILSGVIREQDRVLSPAKRIQLVERKSDYIRQPGIYDNIYCFNSGLCIRTDVLRLVGGYEERLFVDMVDNCLMEQLRMAGQNRIQVVEGDVRQTFSGFHYEDMDAVVRRYHIFRKDFLEFCNICHKSWIYRWLVVRRKINIVLHLVLRGRWDLMKKVSV
jgi:GT2 family glycosyltransferase